MAAGALAAIVVFGACQTYEDEEPPRAVASGLNASFIPDASADCARADLLSLQTRSATGSIVTLDLVLTDCDASLLVNGVAFELDFDDTILDFLGCQNGSLFSGSQLAPGLPECTVSGGHVLGTSVLQLPNSVRVGGGAGGRVDVVRLTFNVTRSGASTPIDFVGTDSLNSSAVFYLDAAIQNPTVYPLGASGYAGGSFVSN